MINAARLLRKLTSTKLKVYWWRYEYPHKLNFGDELTPLIIERLFGIQSVWTNLEKCDIVGIGSIIEHVERDAPKRKIKVWGSGFISEGDSLTTESKLKFSAVRGKLSRARINNTNCTIGDPGLLSSVAFPEFKNTKKKYSIGIVPHYIDSDSPYLKNMRDQKDVLIINALDPVEKVLKDINSCELILSSSLHGLIISDSYGIPNYWLPLSNNLTGGSYKFDDYYSVFGIDTVNIPPQDLGKINYKKLIDKYIVRPNLRQIQKDLIKAFPY